MIVNGTEGFEKMTIIVIIQKLPFTCQLLPPVQLPILYLNVHVFNTSKAA
jgi:hypothetical protein